MIVSPPHEWLPGLLDEELDAACSRIRVPPGPAWPRQLREVGQEGERVRR